MSRQQSEEEIRETHQPCEIVHVDECQWETIRWPGQSGKMLFRPRAQRPTEPNAGVVRYDPGSHHPLHGHDFAQVWYVLEGEFNIGGRTCGPGTMIFHPDPHYEDEMHTETGGLMVLMQYPGPTTAGRPIYDDRFNKKERLAVADERVDL